MIAYGVLWKRLPRPTVTILYSVETADSSPILTRYYELQRSYFLRGCRQHTVKNKKTVIGRGPQSAGSAGTCSAVPLYLLTVDSTHYCATTLHREEIVLMIEVKKRSLREELKHWGNLTSLVLVSFRIPKQSKKFKRQIGYSLDLMLAFPFNIKFSCCE